MKLPLPLLLFVVGFSACSTPPPKTSLVSSEVIGADFDKGPQSSSAALVAAKNASPTPPLNTWTVPQVVDWYDNYLRTEKGDERGLVYQGSDALYHYFVARIPSTKSWIRIAVSKGELSLEKEKSVRGSLWPPHGYDFVDPLQHFRALPR